MDNQLVDGNIFAIQVISIVLGLITMLAGSRAFNDIFDIFFSSQANRWRSALFRVLETFEHFLGWLTGVVGKGAKQGVSFDVVGDAFTKGPVFRGSNKYKIFLKLFVFYTFFSVAMIYSTYPVRPDQWPPSPYLYREDVVTLLMILLLVLSNIVTDMLSIAFTFRNIQALKRSANAGKLWSSFFIVAFDAFLATLCFVISQLMSNAIYPLPLQAGQGIAGPDFGTIFSIDTALMPYAFTDGTNVSEYVFSGQILLTGTVYVPTMILLLFVLSFILIALMTQFVWWLVRSVHPGISAEFHSQTPSGQSVAATCQANISWVIRWTISVLAGAILVWLLQQNGLFPV